MGVADGRVEADGETIYLVKDMKVLFGEAIYLVGIVAIHRIAKARSLRLP